MTIIRFRPSVEEERHLEVKAARYGMTVEDYTATVIACHALDRPLPPAPPPGPRPRETQTERRARLRALDPEGKSPYTRAIEAITTREDLHQ